MGKLILMNRLGSVAEVTNSVVGLNFAIGGSPTYQVGKFGNGVLIDAASERVTIANTPNDLAQGAIEMWVKMNNAVVNGAASTGVRETVFTWYIAGNDNFFRVCFDATMFYWHLKIDGIHSQWQCVEAGIDILAATWTHIAFVWDRTHATKKRRVYIDGTEVADNNLAWNDRNMTSAAFDLGLYHSGWSPLNGIIDNFKWWDYAKTDFSDREHERAGLNDQII